MAASVISHRLRVGQDRNPFVPIHPGWRASLILYVLVYRVFAPGLQEIFFNSGTPLAGSRLGFGLFYQLLLFLPLFFYRREYGWLHPLLFPGMFSLAKQVFTQHGSLLSPLAILSGPPEMEIGHTALAGWSQEAIAMADLRGTLLNVLALGVYYLAFFYGPKIDLPRVRFSPPRRLRRRMLLMIGISAGALLLYIQAQGGVVAHVLSWGGGRHRALGGHGPIHVVIRSALVATLLWYAMDRRVFRRPMFWLALPYALGATFLVNGSRSDLILGAGMFLLIWMIRHARLPQARILVAGVVAFLLIGALGTLRTSSRRGDALDTALLTSWSIERLAEASRGSLESRTGGYLPVVARGPEVGLLYGRTYVAAIAFWIPRAVWQGKPRGAGAHTAERILGRSEGSGGIPPGPVGEAYWNFHVPGIVIIYFLFGIFHRSLAGWLRRYPREPGAWVLYLMALLWATPATTSFIQFMHLALPATALLWWLDAARLARPRGA